ncbi:hypothetical protein C8R48DRAFT_786591, partial [Suillus tomentosus]
NNFLFKCHRKDQTLNTKDQSLVYTINDISFHPVHRTFSACGVLMGLLIHFWDKDSRTLRLKTFEAAPGLISATTFN